MNIFRIFIFLNLVLLIVGCGRSELIRVRILSPISESKKDYTIYQDISLSSNSKKNTISDPATSGASLYLLLKSFGIGYSKISTKIENQVIKSSDSSLILKEETNINTNFADVVFGIGENYTFMWGAGIPMDGSIESELNYGYTGASDETVKSDKISGHSAFFVLGHHGFGFETLLGYRTNFIKVSLDDSLSSAKTLKYSSKINYENNGILITTNQLQLGIGFTF
tara:strand:- start:89 stop:763 length:675 start_codon:yes stop_codon:yes gene_type:complete